MQVRWAGLMVGLLLLWVGPAQADEATTALDAYIEAADDSFAWSIVSQENYQGGEQVELRVTSQTWQGHAWKHQMFLFRPQRLVDQSTAILVIGGEEWDAALEFPPADGQPRQPPHVERWRKLAADTGSIVAVLMQVPHQPMFGELVEDELIVLTFKRFLETRQADWPLLAPMVKSAVRGMDTVQEFARRQWSLEIERFTLTGASKRGWTTWLTAAVDDRVQSLAPMVIDMLNMRAQTLHQLLSWGTFSQQVADYTRAGLHLKMLTEPGRELTRMIDPFEYRASITQPKLIMLGTNDPYWPVDALNLYWEQLTGPKYVYYVPNANHKLTEQPGSASTLAALHMAAGGRVQLPQLDWQFEEQPSGLQVTIRSDTPPKAVRIWTARADSRDFRTAEWQSQPAEQQGDQWQLDVPRSATGFVGAFGELEFEGPAGTYCLSTNVRLIGPSNGAKAAGLPSMLKAFLRFTPAGQMTSDVTGGDSPAEVEQTIGAESDGTHESAEENAAASSDESSGEPATTNRE